MAIAKPKPPADEIRLRVVLTDEFGKKAADFIAGMFPASYDWDKLQPGEVIDLTGMFKLGMEGKKAIISQAVFAPDYFGNTIVLNLKRVVDNPKATIIAPWEVDWMKAESLIASGAVTDALPGVTSYGEHYSLWKKASGGALISNNVSDKMLHIPSGKVEVAKVILTESVAEQKDALEQYPSTAFHYGPDPAPLPEPHVKMGAVYYTAEAAKAVQQVLAKTDGRLLALAKLPAKAKTVAKVGWIEDGAKKDSVEVQVGKQLGDAMTIQIADSVAKALASYTKQAILSGQAVEDFASAASISLGLPASVTLDEKGANKAEAEMAEIAHKYTVGSPHPVGYVGPTPETEISIELHSTSGEYVSRLAFHSSYFASQVLPLKAGDIIALGKFGGPSRAKIMSFDSKISSKTLTPLGVMLKARIMPDPAITMSAKLSKKTHDAMTALVEVFVLALDNAVALTSYQAALLQEHIARARDAIDGEQV